MLGDDKDFATTLIESAIEYGDKKLDSGLSDFFSVVKKLSPVIPETMSYDLELGEYVEKTDEMISLRFQEGTIVQIGRVSIHGGTRRGRNGDSPVYMRLYTHNSNGFLSEYPPIVVSQIGTYSFGSDEAFFMDEGIPKEELDNLDIHERWDIEEEYRRQKKRLHREINTRLIMLSVELIDWQEIDIHDYKTLTVLNSIGCGLPDLEMYPEYQDTWMYYIDLLNRQQFGLFHQALLNDPNRMFNLDLDKKEIIMLSHVTLVSDFPNQISTALRFVDDDFNKEDFLDFLERLTILGLAKKNSQGHFFLNPFLSDAVHNAYRHNE